MPGSPPNRKEPEPRIEPAAVGWFMLAIAFIFSVGLVLASAAPSDNECWQGMYIGSTRRC
jgi:hypothetical protein